MSDALEQGLRAALAERAATLPADARDRLARIDYAPRTRRLPRPTRLWSLASASGATIAAAIVAAVLLLSSGGISLVPLAYAGYAASPIKPTAAELAPAIKECKPWLRPTSGNEGYPGHLVLTDKRGRYVVALYAIGPATEFCIVDGKRPEGGGGGWAVRAEEPAPGPNQLGIPGGGGGGARGFPGTNAADPLGGTEFNIYGLAGRNVSAVTFILADHTTVRATVEHGWYFAWWPGFAWPMRKNRPTEVQVVTRSRSVTSPMPYPGKRCAARARACVFRLHGPSWTHQHGIPY